jgi:threonine dehydrogenase-like Zn-dependent dehydrogenase
MRGVIMHAAGDVRVEDRDDPKIIEPTDAIVKLTATCICGSDLWPYRGIEPGALRGDAHPIRGGAVSGPESERPGQRGTG